MIIYTTERSRYKKPQKKSREQQEAEKKYAELLKKVGYTGEAKKKIKQFPKLKKEPTLEYPYPTSDRIPVGIHCAKRSIDDWRWRKDRQETQETIDEIERKKKRVAIAFNKGAYQYVSDRDDPTAIGKK